MWQPIQFNLQRLLSLIFLFTFSLTFSQISIEGYVKDALGEPLSNTLVTFNDIGDQTNAKGFYRIEIQTASKGLFRAEKSGFYTFQKEVNLTKDLVLNIKMVSSSDVVLDAIIFQADKNTAINSIEISPDDIAYQPSLTGSFTDILKTLPYVSSNTELSSQYMVRGGNYDENLVYINGIQVYRPQLIRAGQQEGLNFLNPSMAANVNFSAGGWEAKYGDKMSSVLDVIYRQPKKFELGGNISLTGANITTGFTGLDNKFTALIGGRYLNRSLILNTLNQDSEFNPESYDIQSYLTYKINPKWQLSFLGNYSRNKFEQIPNTRSVDFGTTKRPINLTVYYNGREEDIFESTFGNFSILHQPSKNLNITLDFFAFHTKEEEYFDIQGAYFIRDEVEEGTVSTVNIGGQIDHARNDLDILVAGVQHRGKFDITNNSDIEWGAKWQVEDARDHLNEWQLIDLAGYSISYNFPSNFVPGESIDEDLLLNYSIQNQNQITSNRLSGYAQYSKKMYWNDAKILLNGGIRATHWDFNGETNISPRAQLAIKPDWERNMLFKISAGIYYQPPFYKEMRRVDGTINNDVESQQSLHFIAGNDYEFTWFGRPFKLETEAYYKKLNNLIPYFVDNVRVNYTGENNSEGFAYGFDSRLMGEFVPGVDSWLSLSYGRIKENIDGEGLISRPTDQRLKASVYFQDYMPLYPSYKVNVTLIYAAGLPNGAPIFTNPYDFQNTLPNYKRVDIGLTKEFISKDSNKTNIALLKPFKSLAFGVEIFNVFNIKNTISRQWIRDVNSGTIYGVPNRLTGRFFNAKLSFAF